MNWGFEDLWMAALMWPLEVDQEALHVPQPHHPENVEISPI